MKAVNGKPRPHHYEFAHRALPSVMLNPHVDLARLAADMDRLDVALRATWAEIGERVTDDERLPDAGLTVQVVRVDGKDAVLISLPPALEVTEAVHVLVVPLNPPDARRFFTLERGWDVVSGRERNVLGSWENDGHHIWGHDLPGDADAFTQAVSRIASP